MEGNIMRRKIILYLYKHHALHWILWLFHRTVGCNQFIRMKGSNIVDSSTANIYKDAFIVKHGTNNRVIIGEKSDLHNSIITFKGTNNTVRIGKNGFLNGLNIIVEGDNGQLIIGDNAFILGDTRIYVVDGATFKMGDGCMLSDRIEIRTTDNHSIIDRSTGKRINYEKDIVLHDNVWIGTGVTILKGVELANACIVGAASVITKKLMKESSVIAGNPARVVRENVYWRMERIK